VIFKDLVAKGSCKKEHSNYHGKYFSESGESKDVSKSHAECNIVHFSGSKVEILAVYSYKESYSRETAFVLLSSTNGGAMPASCMGFVAQKKK